MSKSFFGKVIMLSSAVLMILGSAFFTPTVLAYGSVGSSWATPSFPSGGYCFSCSPWMNGACGGSCGAGKRIQTRTCTPSGCQAQSQCVSDPSCSASNGYSGSISMSVNGTYAPVTAKVTGNLSGGPNTSYDLYFWSNCPNSCGSLATCTAVCQTPVMQKTGQPIGTSYTFTQVYGVAGNYTAKVLMSTGSFVTAGNASVSVH
jgi:hypothetical protein